MSISLLCLSQDTLQMVDDLSNKTELLLFDVRRLVNDTAISNVAASQLTQVHIKLLYVHSFT